MSEEKALRTTALLYVTRGRAGDCTAQMYGKGQAEQGGRLEEGRGKMVLDTRVGREVRWLACRTGHRSGGSRGSLKPLKRLRLASKSRVGGGSSVRYSLFGAR